MKTAFFVALAVMAVRVVLFYNGRSLEGPGSCSCICWP